MPIRLIYLLSLFLPILLSACSDTPTRETTETAKTTESTSESHWYDIQDYFSVYHLDVRQGNSITQEMVSQLRPGLSREQVRYVLGTPLLTDPFHGDRWDYVYRYDNGYGEVQQRRMSVYFEDNKLSRVSGDVAAAPQSPAAEAGQQAVDSAKPGPLGGVGFAPKPGAEFVPAPAVPAATPQ